VLYSPGIGTQILSPDFDFCEQEIISRERKDRRDFEQLAQLADRMSLHRCFIVPPIS
jgi:hypothetical protein